MAVSSDGECWFLVNASPDIGRQVNGFEPLRPRPGKVRESRLGGVLLTNGDLDHVVGLLLLREGPALSIHATAAVRECLIASGIDGVLSAFCGVSWHEPGARFENLAGANGKEGGLAARAIPLPGTPPPFLKKSAYEGGHSVAYQIEDRMTGGRLLVAPDVSAITPGLAEALDESDVVLFDGTFWSNDELRRVRRGARLSEEMGHLPVGGEAGSLDLLRKLPARHRVYFHINNTNPMLASGSAERAEVEAAGVIVGYDGLEFMV